MRQSLAECRGLRHKKHKYCDRASWRLLSKFSSVNSLHWSKYCAPLDLVQLIGLGTLVNWFKLPLRTVVMVIKRGSL
jgi:hypothetical protein